MKDMSWCALWRVAGMSMSLPALAVAIWITWHSRKVRADCVHNAAVCLWVSANITWMTGEFFFADRTRQFASGFFASGMALLLGYYAYEGWCKFRTRHPCWPGTTLLK